MKRINLTLLSLSLATIVSAQEYKSDFKEKQADSLSALDEAALLYPRIRQLSITHQQGLTGDIHAKYDGKPLFDGRYQLSRTTINFNLPIIEGKQSSLIGSLGVVHQFTNITEVSSYDAYHPVYDTNNYTPMIALGAAFVHRDSLFNHPVTFTAALSGLFNPEFSRRQFSFTGLVTVPLIQKPYTRLNAGFVVNIDPSSPIPAFLLFSYFHKFRAANLDLLIDAPYRVALRKPIKEKASVTLQTELVGNNAFLDLNAMSLPQKLTYSTLEIKSGLLFEYRLTKKMVFSVSGGVVSTATSKVFEQGEKPSNYLVKNSQSAVPYGQVGISFLPFWRPFKR